MQLPLQIIYRGLGQSAALEERIREKLAKLETFHQRIISCRVVVEREPRQRHQDGRFTVRVDLHVPGHELVLDRDHADDVYIALRDAFDAARRVLEEQQRVARHQVKHHEDPRAAAGGE